eukprot:scaffold5515_cov159-Amphora_coffeaeformis.AAC.2
MDVIWKELSDNNRECRRLLLYSETDPGTGATFAVRCNATIGVTSEDNFRNDAMYLVEGVLPMNHTLEAIEIDWTFLQPLEEEERDHLLRGIASIQTIKEILIRGGTDDESRLDVRSILLVPEFATNITDFSVEVSELGVQDAVDLELLACHLRRCHKLESIHLRGMLSMDESSPLDCNILLASLATLPSLRVVHLSQKDGKRKSLTSSTLRQVCRLPRLTSLSLMNMGLTDKHCSTFLKCLKSAEVLHSLVLVDNPGITEEGNQVLLELLRHNRSIFNSTFGTDSDTKYRVEQLSLLHMNRCGRKIARAPANLRNWTSYVARINETVPEELELDALFAAVKENPEFFLSGHEADLLGADSAEEDQITAPIPAPAPAISVESVLDLEGKLVEMRRLEIHLVERERLLRQRENAVAQQLRTIQELEREQRARQEKRQAEQIVEDKEMLEHDSPVEHDILSLCSGSELKNNESMTMTSSMAAWKTLSQIEQHTNETLQLTFPDCLVGVVETPSPWSCWKDSIKNCQGSAVELSLGKRHIRPGLVEPTMVGFLANTGSTTSRWPAGAKMICLPRKI